MELDISRDKEIPLFRQIFDELKSRILDGRIAGGFKLPSTRDLAAELQVSRNVVLEAYDQLFAEGYTESRTGDGTYAVEGVRFEEGVLPDISAVKPIGFKTFDEKIIDFRSGLPDLNALPVKKWLQISREVYLNSPRTAFAYGQPEGTAELRTAIARYTSAYRGVKCHPDQILITGGTTQAIGIVSRLLLGENNKTVCLEDPVTIDIVKIVSGAGGNVHPVPVDNEGIIFEEIKNNPVPAFIYVTPSHHFPLGVTLSVKRRIELIEYARKNSVYLVEDDYDSEFRYDVKPTSSLQGFDPQRVIYLGTFSKTLFPALRIGYIIFPPELINKGRRQKWFSDLHNSVMDQLVLARFIEEGHFARTVASMKKKHRSRRDFLVSALKSHFGPEAEILGTSVGIHMAVRFRGIDFNRRLLEVLEDKGVRIYPVEEHAIIKGKYTDTIILGFGFISREKIGEGIKILKETLTGC